MKNSILKNLLLLLSIFGVGFAFQSCIDEIELRELSNGVTTPSQINGETRSLNEIMAISDSVVGKTRATLAKGIWPIVDGKDTVAYVVNYSNNSGFTIISANKNVTPVLAFSRDRNFSFDNEIVNRYFLNNIKSYADEVIRKHQYKEESDDDIITYERDPIIRINLGQRAPYDSIVQVHHPGCYVGCAPVSAVMIMAYCKSQVTYNNKLYNFRNIKAALIKGPSYNPIDTVPKINPNTIKPLVTTWTNNYWGCLNAIRDLLYEVGELMGCEYTSKGTSAKFGNTPVAFTKTGYKIGSIYEGYNPKMMVDSIDSEHIWFQCGQSTENPKNGHYWVIDGYKYDLVCKNDSIVNCQFYCHWGWYGEDDGYYLGEIFNPFGEKKYKAIGNFWVKIEEE